VGLKVHIYRGFTQVLQSKSRAGSIQLFPSARFSRPGRGCFPAIPRELPGYFPVTNRGCFPPPRPRRPPREIAVSRPAIAVYSAPHSFGNFAMASSLPMSTSTSLGWIMLVGPGALIMVWVGSAVSSSSVSAVRRMATTRTP